MMHGLGDCSSSISPVSYLSRDEVSNGPWCYSEVKLLGLIDRTNGLLVRKVATNPTEKASLYKPHALTCACRTTSAHV